MKLRLVLLLFSFTFLFIACEGPIDGLPGAPDTPTNVTVVLNPFGPVRYLFILVKWNSVSEADEYGIFRSEEGSSSYSLIGTSSTVQYEDRTATTNIDYTYAVKAYNLGGSSDLSDPTKIIQLPVIDPGLTDYYVKPDIYTLGLNNPMSIKFHENNLFIVDTDNDRIVRINTNGSTVMWLGDDGFTTDWHTGGTPVSGSGNGQFAGPEDIAFDNSGFMYIADTNNNRIQKISSDGTFIAWLGDDGTDTGWHTTGTTTIGSGDGQFNSPESVALDDNGNIFIADNITLPDRGRIQKFYNNGDHVKTLVSGSASTNPGEFGASISKIYIYNEELYVTDTFNNRIQKFDSDLSLSSAKWLGLDGTIGWHTTGTAAPGIGDGQFNAPLGVYVDYNGYIYVTDTQSQRIQLYAYDGTLLGWLGTENSGNSQGWWPINPVSTGYFSITSNFYMLYDPSQVAVGYSGNEQFLYICNRNIALYTIKVFRIVHN